MNRMDTTRTDRKAEKRSAFRRICPPSSKPAGGFSLVEIMVGMVIGLLGIIIMLQMLSVSENQKRNTSGGDDAQNAGAIALYGLQRDIRLSGYGISAQGLMGCNVQLRAGVTLNAIAPVTINHASIPAAAHDANTDTVLMVYGNANGPGEGDGITAQPNPASAPAVYPTVYTVQTPPSYSYISATARDYLIAQYGVRQTPCSLSMDTLTAAPNGNNVIVASGVASIMTTNNANGLSPSLYNLGQSPRIMVYAVRNSNLTVCDYMVNDCGSAANATINTANQAIWVPIAGNIVSLRAQYGRDTLTAPIAVLPSQPPYLYYKVDTYDQTTPTTACGFVRVSTVRIALVAQGSSGASTTAAPVWAGSATNPINLGALTGWQNYRYKVFQTVAPIRNITMQGVVAGC